MAQLFRLLPPDQWTRLTGGIQRVLPPGLAQRNIGEKLYKASQALGARSIQELYQGIIAKWPSGTPLVIDGQHPKTLFTDRTQQPTTDDDVHQMMAIDTLSYLPNNGLVKVDRATMSSGLEARFPMLDRHVVELAWQMPLHYKLRDGVGKWPLREVLYRHVPRELIERPKQGFGIPIDTWLRGPLREWAEDLLDEGRLHREGYLHPEPIRRAWKSHLSGKNNLQHSLWGVLMFQAWLETQ